MIETSTANEFYITDSSDGVSCPEYATNCHLLSFYVSRFEEYFKSNTVFNFLEGTHQLQNEPIVLKGLFNVTLQGRHSAASSSVPKLQCQSGQGGIVFLECMNITINRIILNNCTNDFNNTSLERRNSIAFYNSSNINIVELLIERSVHSGIVIVNTLNVSIFNSNFTYNALKGSGSNVVVVFEDSNPASHIGTTYLDIFNTDVSFSGSNGLSVNLSQTEFFVNVSLLSSSFIYSYNRNIIMTSVASCQYALTINNTVCNYSINGGGLLIVQNTACKWLATPTIEIKNSVFAHNAFSCFSVAWYSSNPGILNIMSSVFNHNEGAQESVLLIELIKQPILPDGGSSLMAHLTNLTFDQNRHNATQANIYGIARAVRFTTFIVNANNIIFENCRFTNNKGSAILMYNSYVTFRGNNTFINNTSIYGGGLSLINNAFLLVDSNTRMIFINNNAAVEGGAIHVDQLLTRLYNREEGNGLVAYCFYQVQNAKPTHGIFYFQNNTAGIAGSALYGDITDNCFFFGYPSYYSPVANSFFFNNISVFVNQPGDSVLSSGPRKICFCKDNAQDCETESRHYSAFPGDDIIIPTVIIGNGGGLTTGVIQVSSGNSEENFRLDARCKNIIYSVKSDDVNATSKLVTIAIASNDSNIKYTPLKINISLEPCSEGFHLSSGVCKCTAEIQRLSEECYNTRQMVERSGKIWFGYEDNLNCTITSSRCPFDYCMFSSVNVSLLNPNVQCANNRIGRLCGDCPHNLSLELGSNACKDCKENASVLIMIPFALAGIALVFLLFFLNLTVSVGTINGLIFFANIIKIYESLLPIEPIPFLAQFISWLNLDFGIPVCFYDGMCACGKIGFQFAFPFYLWSIMLIIVVISKYSLKVATLLGNNTIPVFATLLLLSYTKLLRTVILIFATSSISCNGDKDLFWFVNPTQRYCSGCHLPLFVIALLLMVIVIVPYTLFLLLYPVLEISSAKVREKLSWFLIKLKPFFDAYRGPHNNLFYFYPGALLLVRIILALVVGIDTVSDVSLDILLATSIILITMLSIGKVYKKGSYIHLLDILFLLGFIVLSYAVDRTYSEKFVSTHATKYGTIIILLLSFFIFVFIITYHFFKYTWPGKKSEILLQNGFKRITRQGTKNDEEEDDQVGIFSKDVIADLASLNNDAAQLRESLLES